MHFTSLSNESIQDLLARTSRTFALAIPLLPFPARREVSLAYLLLRVADTIEDGCHLSRAEKLDALREYGDLLDLQLSGPANTQGLTLPRPPLDNRDYLDLLDQLPSVLISVAELPLETRTAVIDSIRRSTSGMMRFVTEGRTEGAICLRSLAELRDYCYFVAGLVGEMLTQIFLTNARHLSSARDELESRARWFGEGLQLVNILKDSDEDAGEGRTFIPASVPREKVFEMARVDLEKARQFVNILRTAEAPAGFVAFTELPLQLAWRTLECVEEGGPGSKVPKAEVLELMAKVVGVAELEGASGTPATDASSD